MSPLPVANRLLVGLGATEITDPNVRKTLQSILRTSSLLTRVLVTLEHHLGISGVRVPELNAPVLGTTHDPLSIRRQADTEHEILLTKSAPGYPPNRAEPARYRTYLVAFKGSHAFAPFDAASRQEASWCSKLPHLDRLVKTAADQVTAIRRERNRIHAVLVAVGALQSFHKVTGRGIPDPDTLVERASGHVMTVRRHSHCGDTVFNAEGVYELALQDIPQAHRLVPTTRGNVATVSSIVKGIDVLFMSGKDMLDGSSSNIPNLPEEN